MRFKTVSTGCRTQPSAAATGIRVSWGTVAQAATLHVRIRYFSFADKALLLPGSQGNSLDASNDACVQSTSLSSRFQMNRVFRFIAPCTQTLICSSLIQRLTLAAAFAAAFFMGDGFVAQCQMSLRTRVPSYIHILQERRINLSELQTNLYISIFMENTFKPSSRNLHPSQTHVF